MQSCFILLLSYDLYMKSGFCGDDVGFKQAGKTGKTRHVPEYFVFTEIEIISLIFCVTLDVVEYAAAILLMPLVGDVFDVAGIFFCVFVFRWVGLFSFVELVPGADVLPVFIITWLVWFLLKKQKRLANKVQYYRFRAVLNF